MLLKRAHGGPTIRSHIEYKPLRDSSEDHNKLSCWVGQIGLRQAGYCNKSGRAMKVETKQVQDKVEPVLAAYHQGSVGFEFKLTLVHRGTHIENTQWIRTSRRTPKHLNGQASICIYRLLIPSILDMKKSYLQAMSFKKKS